MVKFNLPWRGPPISFGRKGASGKVNIGPTYRMVGNRWRDVERDEIESAFIDLLLDASNDGDDAFSVYSIWEEVWGVDIDWNKEELFTNMTRMEQKGVITKVPDSEKVITRDQEMPDLSKYDPREGLTRFVRLLSWRKRRIL